MAWYDDAWDYGKYLNPITAVAGGAEDTVEAATNDEEKSVFHPNGGESDPEDDPMTTEEQLLADYKQMQLDRDARRDATVDELTDAGPNEFGNAPQGLGKLENAAYFANATDDAALEDYLGQLDAYDPLAASDFVGNVNSVAAGAHADASSISAQKDALGKYKALTDPTVTAKERFLMETARAQEERDRASAMDAALRDQEARGIRSGGSEIAALTGIQDTTSQNRMLQDLGTQAGAVDRSMAALEGYRGTAGDIRDASFNEDYSRGTAADRVGMFNKKMKGDYQAWKDDFDAGERDKSVDRDTLGYDAGTDVTNRKFGREGALYNEKEDAASLRLGNEAQKSGESSDYLKLMMGKEADERARKELEDDDGLFGLGIGPF